MNAFFVFAVHNTIVALVFALLVYGLTRIWRNPPVAHVLWLLVLIKLLAPPVMRVEWPVQWPQGSTDASSLLFADLSQNESQQVEGQPEFVDQPSVGTSSQAAITTISEPDRAAWVRQFWNRSEPVLLGVWIGGASLCALVAATRIVRFERLLRDTLPASERLQQLTQEVAAKLGVRRPPLVRYVECVTIPLLWRVGRRATIVLPLRLVRELDERQVALILAHELAHLRRRDDWVRIVELVASIVYWWNPLVGVIRRQLHQAEDLCCDAWVRVAFPEHTKLYAEVVLKSAESLSAAQVGARLLPASQFLNSLSLKARIEMILKSQFAPRVSKKSMFVIVLLAFLVLPLFVQGTKREALADSTDESTTLADSNKIPLRALGGTVAKDQAVEYGLAWLAQQQAEKTSRATTSEFPYAVKFEQGATRFLKDDNITITEISGTAETFTPGNIYVIKGTYKLASRDRATLSAYTTAMDSKNGTGYSFKVQSTVVDQRDGAFTLYLPMSCRGWPHVSFYPADGGEGFGGKYFGTGDSVLKRWWGEKETDPNKSGVRDAGQ